MCWPENCVAIAAAGGIERVVSAMAGHAGSAGVQESGCDALWNLAARHAGMCSIDAAMVDPLVYLYCR